MLKFLLGVMVGSTIGYLGCAMLSINNSEKGRKLPTPVSKEIGDNCAGN